MKRLRITALAIMLAATGALAEQRCWTHWITDSEGRTIACQTCCDDGNCTTWCR